MAAASLTLTSSGIVTLLATATPSLAASSDTQEATIESTNSFESTYQLADGEVDDDNDDAEGDDDDDDDNAEATAESLPEPIAKAVLNDVQQRSGLQASQLRIINVEQQTWTDGCLGLGDGICTQALVPGWQVIVAGNEQVWAYRTNESGSSVKLDTQMSQTLTSRVATEVTRRQQVTTRTTQSTVTGTSGRQSTQVVTGASGSQSTQVTGTTQRTGQVSAQTQQQMAATRSSVQTSFTDVAQGYWARDFIAELAARQIIEGFPDGKFRPNEPVTRAQFAAMLRKAFKTSKVRNAINFRDISSRHWAYYAIREAYEMGFLATDAGNQFNPNRSLTRLDILVALTNGLNYSFTGSTDSILRFYSDVTSIPANYRTLIAAATQRGIVVNYPNVRSLSVNTVATRAEVAAFIYQALVSTGEVTAISSPYIVGGELGTVEFNQTGPSQTQIETGGSQRIEQQQPGRDRVRRNCNQGIGNGAEGCDPGNSRPHGGSNDEGGRTPGNRPNR